MKSADSAHRHGPDGDLHDHQHDHGGTAFTTWMDYDIASAQVAATAKALIAQLPEQKDAILARKDQLRQELQSLDQRMNLVGEKLKNQHFVVSHPVYQYWARAYQISVQSLHWEPEQTLDQAALAELRGNYAGSSSKNDHLGRHAKCRECSSND